LPIWKCRDTSALGIIWSRPGTAKRRRDSASACEHGFGGADMNDNAIRARVALVVYERGLASSEITAAMRSEDALIDFTVVAQFEIGLNAALSMCSNSA
jgi:hypothetical protein